MSYVVHREFMVWRCAILFLVMIACILMSGWGLTFFSEMLTFEKLSCLFCLNILLAHDHGIILFNPSWNTVLQKWSCRQNLQNDTLDSCHICVTQVANDLKIFPIVIAWCWYSAYWAGNIVKIFKCLYLKTWEIDTVTIFVLHEIGFGNFGIWNH